MEKGEKASSVSREFINNALAMFVENPGEIHKHLVGIIQAY